MSDKQTRNSDQPEPRSETVPVTKPATIEYFEPWEVCGVNERTGIPYWVAARVV